VLLARHSGKVLTHKQILTAIWGPGIVLFSCRLAVNAHRPSEIPREDDPRSRAPSIFAHALTFLTMAAVFYSFAAVVSWFFGIARPPLFFIATPILIWFFWSFCRWRRKHIGDQNELEWLEELMHEHEIGIKDHSGRLEFLISTIEKEHDWTLDLQLRLDRARRVLKSSGKR
jgi:hypothetical protein